VKAIHGWLGIVAVTATVGCATKPFDAQPRSASELTIALESHYSGLVDRPFVRTSAPTDPSGEFRWLSRCVPNNLPSAFTTARASYASLCERLGATWREPYCVGPSDRDRVLFMARMSTGPHSCMTVEVLEPTRDPMAPAYVGTLRGTGYQTSADLAAARQRISEREMHRAIEAERRAALLPRMRMRGTRVCHLEGGNTWMGFVEDSTEDKLQIRVVAAYRTGLPQINIGGFQPHVTWDVPARWQLCE
jgi:hypothetical protein